MRYFAADCGLAVGLLFTFAREARMLPQYFLSVHRITRDRSGSGCDRQDRDEPILRVPSSAGAVSNRYTDDTNQVSLSLPMTARATVISCGRRRTVKQLRERAGNIVNTIPGRLDSRSNPRQGSLLACYRRFSDRLITISRKLGRTASPSPHPPHPPHSRNRSTLSNAPSIQGFGLAWLRSSIGKKNCRSALSPLLR